MSVGNPDQKVYVYAVFLPWGEVLIDFPGKNPQEVASRSLSKETPRRAPSRIIP